MDIFNYTLKIQELDRVKYKKDVEAIIREMYKNATSTHTGRYSYFDVDTKNYQEMKLIYKIWAKALQHKAKPTLAAFLTESFTDLEKKMYAYAVGNTSYEELLDVFQYSMDVKTYGGLVSGRYSKLVEIVRDRALPFKVEHDLGISQNYGSIGYIIQNTPTMDVANIRTGNFNLLIELEDFKSKLDKDINYTVLEDTLKELYSAIASHKNKPVTTYIQEVADDVDSIRNAIGVIQTKLNG